MNIESFLSNKYVTKYASAVSSNGEKKSLFDELLKIKDGSYKEIISECRRVIQDNKQLYAKLKSQLPAMTFCGVFQGSHKTDNLISYNQIIIIDIDNIDSEKVDEIKKLIFEDKYVFACWVSPSGKGLKVLIHVDSSYAMHKFSFNRIIDYLFANYNIEADLSGSDICRLCFVSHDESMMIKKDFEVFPMDEDEWLAELISSNRTKVGGEVSEVQRREDVYLNSEKILFSKTEGRNKIEHRQMAKKILRHLKKTDQSITKSYKDWLKVAFAVANSFTYDIGKNIFLDFCRLDGADYDKYKSERLLEYCYIKRQIDKVNFSSIIYLAVQKGFIVNPIKKKGK